MGTDPADEVGYFEEGIDQEGYLAVVECPWQFAEGFLEKYLCSHPWSYLVADERLHPRPLRSYDRLRLLAHLGQLNPGW